VLPLIDIFLFHLGKLCVPFKATGFLDWNSTMTTLIKVYLDNQFIHHNLFVTLKPDTNVDNDALGRSTKSK